ncbi:MAG: tetratricopeptide repeat protein [Verrucomicrobiota bacterium]
MAKRKPKNRNRKPQGRPTDAAAEESAAAEEAASTAAAEPAESSDPQDEETRDILAAALAADTESKVEQFIEKYRLAIVGGIALAVILTVVGVIMIGMNETARIERAQAFSAASSIEELDVVIAQYDGTTEAGNAKLRKAGFLEDDDKINEAKTTLLTFLDEYPKHPRRAQANIILARFAADEGNADQARRYYEAVEDESDLRPLAMLGIGDLEMQAGEHEKARRVYEDIPLEHIGNKWVPAATERMERIDSLLAAKDAEPLPAPPPDPVIEEDPATTTPPGTLPGELPKPQDFIPTTPSVTDPAPAPAEQPKPQEQPQNGKKKGGDAKGKGKGAEKGQPKGKGKDKGKAQPEPAPNPDPAPAESAPKDKGKAKAKGKGKGKGAEPAPSEPAPEPAPTESAPKGKGKAKDKGKGKGETAPTPEPEPAPTEPQPEPSEPEAPQPE